MIWEKKNSELIDRLEMSGEVFRQIKESIGAFPAETGGMLGMSGEKIDRFFFDNSGIFGMAEYSPDTSALNNELEKWTADKVVYMGHVHSHPLGIKKPSHADYEYVKQILKHNEHYENAKSYFYFPIVQTKPDCGEFKLYSYVAGFVGKKFVVKEISLFVDGVLYQPEQTSKEQHRKIKELYPLQIMAQKTVVCVGCGGARSYLENLCRNGIEQFVLIDGDRVCEQNIATQAVNFANIGEYKVHAIAENLKKINPDVRVLTLPIFLSDMFSDSGLVALIGENLFKEPQDVLLLGCTDSFYANARCARLALKYGFPYIQAGVYQDGTKYEISFSYPGVTPSCTRCATHDRYETYKNGYVSNTTSDNSPIFAIEHINTMLGYISLMLLLYGTDCRFGNVLEKYKNKNFLQVNLDFCSAEPFGETVFFEQLPDNPENGYDACSDCGGSGDLRALIGEIPDTRILF